MDMNEVIQQRLQVAKLGLEDRKSMTTAKAFDFALEAKHKKQSYAVELEMLVAKRHIENNDLDKAMEVIKDLKSKGDCSPKPEQKPITNINQLSFA